jgi:hypothetical protein
MTTQRLVRTLWSYYTVLRDDGLSDGECVDQSTSLLFPKMADELLRDVEAHTDVPMPAMELNARFYQAHDVASDRAPSGRARRSGRGE